jgi:hypothetical protein
MRFILKTVLCALFATAAFNASAQWYVGGSATLLLTEDTQALTLSPEAGYWLNENWAVGGIVDITAQDSYDACILKPYVRYAFMQIGTVTAVAEAFAPIGVDDDDFIVGATVGPAILIPFTDKCSFTTRLGSLGIIAGSDYNNFRLIAGPVSFGFTYSF